MKLEVLYFEGCPNHLPAIERVREVLNREGINAAIEEVAIPDAGTARRYQFLGSPSIRVNGVDVEPAARDLKSFGIVCRTYMEGGNRSGLPSAALIRAALLNPGGN